MISWFTRGIRCFISLNREKYNMFHGFILILLLILLFDFFFCWTGVGGSSKLISANISAPLTEGLLAWLMHSKGRNTKHILHYQHAHVNSIICVINKPILPRYSRQCNNSKISDYIFHCRATLARWEVSSSSFFFSLHPHKNHPWAFSLQAGVDFL